MNKAGCRHPELIRVSFFAESSKTGNCQFGCHTVRGLRVSLKMHDKCVSCRLSKECQKKAGRSDENARRMHAGQFMAARGQNRTDSGA